jgi:shikimate dehydrogenase
MERYGLIGKRLDYSFSKTFFTDKFTTEEIDAVYENIELSDDKALADFFKSSVKQFEGLNVTIPYKEKVIPFLDELSSEARQIGAVNTIKVVDGKIIGYNTDAFGFQNSIKPFLRNIHEKALILGTGGASKAVEYVLKNIGIDVFYLSRTPEGPRQFFYEQANEIMMNSFKLIVNCTPLGTYPNITQQPNIPVEFVSEDHLVIDLIYNPVETQLLAKANAQGADTMNGLSMLQHQALKAWEIWQS